ncbi:glycine betaine ABC transporter substrate-binding protein [Noviherbaspirillum sp. CPCC 100848]|uniref:Glycine betaine ABC transporter substrate-binding protein n=1 Tax=Noviherbaspirillum album TaxID=3080276 RepID=A0ABU6JDA6_9BURK|nr:glycine betaine ABC transporter substrate-binding protein [Noviherbaspirillum sp. CPCC 100848]MEC4721625.1 glycine betaine ABC transporter substrate-binding protein [Noviherbaspirillum sp. CPCC 100848]
MPLVFLCCSAWSADTLKSGSKRFTESYILGEIVARAAASHAPVEHRQGLGNTAIVFEALRTGSIDIYPEYTGTIEREILKQDASVPAEEARGRLAELGIGIGVPLGFNNSYALAMRADDAKRLGIRALSDLGKHPQLRLGLSHEFLGRADGWPGLSRRYALGHSTRGMDHGIAYDALSQGHVDVIDIYATDAKIEQLGLRVLDDDLDYFPRYDAVLLYRLDVERRFPEAWRAIQALQNRIRAEDMIRMNAAAELQGKSFAAIAGDFLAGGQAAANASPDAPMSAGIKAETSIGLHGRLFDGNLWRLTRQHVFLVAASVGVAVLIGIPLGIAAASVPVLRHAIMAVVGVLQTIPSLALLAMLIPVLGTIGMLPALIALFLYALLPIVRNTCIGLQQVPAGLRQAALALGLSRRQRLLHIDLPLCMPVILAGVKTAAVVNVGTATIAAFIGAGGYGERIATGLALNDNTMLLAGAIPAAVLALLTQWLFDLAEHACRRVHSRPAATEASGG